MIQQFDEVIGSSRQPCVVCVHLFKKLSWKSRCFIYRAARTESITTCILPMGLPKAVLAGMVKEFELMLVGAWRIIRLAREKSANT